MADSAVVGMNPRLRKLEVCWLVGTGVIGLALNPVPVEE
jgi:hypothetical protein